MNRFTHLDYHNKGFDLPLFETPLARNTDPVTSHKAAQQVTFKGEHHRKIYEALKTMKDGTFYEISEVAEMEPAAVWRRLNELEKRNLIVQTGEERRGPTGRMCRIWKVK